jgi:hypothetical protein
VKVVLLVAAATMLLTGCSRRPANEIDAQVTTLGDVEVTAQVVEIPEPFPANDLYNYAYVLKYRVLKVHRGNPPGTEILVGQYNPLKPRDRVQDDVSGKVGGHVQSIRAHDVHRMALASPLDQHWMGGIIDKYFDRPGTRYWAIWTNPGAE